MRKKYTSKTYMRGVSDWDLVIIKRKFENYYLTIKRINEIDEKFIVKISGKEKIYIDNGYYIVEFTPLDKFYNARVYIDKNLNIMGYYFDISHGNGIDENIPYYDDSYLDIIYCPSENDYIKIDDENELLEAFATKNITKEEFDLANKECSILIDELEEKKNIFVNMNKKELIQKYFKEIDDKKII